MTQQPKSSSVAQAGSHASPSFVPIEERVDRSLKKVFSIVDVFGRNICGDWWQPVYESVQDAIGLGLLVTVPSLLIKLLTGGKDFSGFDACIQIPDTTWWSTDRYACFVVVLADLTGWAVLAGRILQRFIMAFKVPKRKGGKNAKRS